MAGWGGLGRGSWRSFRLFPKQRSAPVMQGQGLGKDGLWESGRLHFPGVNSLVPREVMRTSKQVQQAGWMASGGCINK